ncbi:uncharacterized protein LOC110007977 [Amborella trichopoda]|uniref:uncharacterized protein LOC110007977 n=1 Tax=Amborella trichopoda TaxID=13333 RepID=UPI0009BD9F11|nr:uncharacterized protein LOC110007977 [Amborella trichopoda]|eukprot:XP_020528249.1 uncharacterized protein LOC110007977 [Amborella trichopoda]
MEIDSSRQLEGKHQKNGDSESTEMSRKEAIAVDLKTKKMIGGGRESGGLYYLGRSLVSAALRSGVSPLQWHCWLVHPSINNLKLLVPSLESLSTLECETCELSKHHRISFHPRVNKRMFVLVAVVHSNIWGPARVQIMSSYKYFLIFVDDFSGMTWISIRQMIYYRLL